MEIDAWILLVFLPGQQIQLKVMGANGHLELEFQPLFLKGRKIGEKKDEEKEIKGHYNIFISVKIK